MRSWKAIFSVILSGALCAIPALAAPNLAANAPAPQQQQVGPQQSQQGPEPGMINYVEGTASIGGQQLNQNSAGNVELRPGEILTTAQSGKVEVLLTPGTLLRVDSNSAVRMDSNGLADIEVTVMHGRAMVESDQLLKHEYIAVHVGPATVRLKDHGLYEADANTNQIFVFDGRAEVSMNSQNYSVQHGHVFDLTAAKLKARGFDKKSQEDAFYRWNSLRSSYLAQANSDAARGFAGGYYGGPYYGGFGYYPGWFWDPYFDAYTWLPYDNYFYSPFGYGFYSPGFAYVAPFYGVGGYYGGGHYRHFDHNYRPPVARGGFSHGGGGHAIVGGTGGGIHGGGFPRGFGGGSHAVGGVHGGAPAGGFSRGGGMHGGGGRR